MLYQSSFGMGYQPIYQQTPGMTMQSFNPQQSAMGHQPIQPQISYEMYQTNAAYALPLIKQSVQGERNDELLYDYLISQAPSKKEKEIIRTIRDDERRHRQMFRQIYYSLTGQMIQSSDTEPFKKPATYLEGVEQALFGELAAVERYRTIYHTVPGTIFKNMVFDILTDELKHASKYNFIYTTNK